MSSYPPVSGGSSASGLLVLDRVTKRFRGLTALDAVSMRVSAGEIVGVIGPNGSGKTTLFATISGFLRPDGGAIMFEGRSLVGLRPSAANARGLARTFQIVQPFGGLSVRDNVIAGALRGGRETLASARRAAAEVLDLVGLSGVGNQLAATLTIADRKRLEMARALATRPKLLLLDEVMAGLRPAEVDAAISLVRRIRDEGVTVIVVEHLIRAVLALSERMYVLHHGSVIAEGEPREVIHRREVVSAYFGTAPVDA
jgi:branched-chain amino acid transport system ATP-binding protein